MALVALASGIVLSAGPARAAQTVEDVTISSASVPTPATTTQARAANQATCNPGFSFDGTNYVSRICNVPDYDQHRAAGVLRGAGQRPLKLDRYPLQGDGGCHCVPTSFTNLLGYYVSNGVAGSYPRKFDWDGRVGYLARPNVPAESYLNGQPYPIDEARAYDAATRAIKLLGTGVSTSPCGTNWESVLKYFEHFRTLLPEVSLTTTTVTPGDPRNVAKILAAGGTVAAAYGFYSHYTEADGVANLGPRSGGHAVTIQAVQGNTAEAFFRISDPASSADPLAPASHDGDYFRQSRFSPLTPNLKRVSTSVGTRWRWGPIHTWPEYGGAKIGARVLEALMVVYPQYAIYAKAATIQYQVGLSFDKQSKSLPRELSSKAFRVGGTVLDAAFLPASGEIAYLTKGNASVQAVAVGTGAMRVLGVAPKGARELEIDPTGQQIFLGGSDELVQMDSRGENVSRTKLSSPVQALAFDAGTGLGNGRIVSITADRNLRRHVPGSLAAGAPSRIPKSLVQGSGPLSASFDRSGKLILRRGSSNRIAVRGAGVRRRTLPALRGAGGMATGDRGTLVTVSGGRLVELSQSGNAVPNSALTGRRAHGRVLQVTRSGSDVPAEQADQLIDQRTVHPAVPEMAP